MYVFWSHAAYAACAAFHAARLPATVVPATYGGGGIHRMKTLGLAAMSAAYSVAVSVCICKSVRPALMSLVPIISTTMSGAPTPTVATYPGYAAAVDAMVAPGCPSLYGTELPGLF